MRVIHGDLWEGDGFIVVPTNLRWRADGKAVMGRGVALEAGQRFPGLADWYGVMLRSGLRALTVWQRLVLFPTKDDWRRPSELPFIESGARQLAEHPAVHGTVSLPLLGCGCGGLAPSQVLPILHRILTEDRFVLVLPRRSS